MHGTHFTDHELGLQNWVEFARPMVSSPSPLTYIYIMHSHYSTDNIHLLILILSRVWEVLCKFCRWQYGLLTLSNFDIGALLHCTWVYEKYSNWVWNMSFIDLSILYLLTSSSCYLQCVSSQHPSHSHNNNIRSEPHQYHGLPQAKVGLRPSRLQAVRLQAIGIRLSG